MKTHRRMSWLLRLLARIAAFCAIGAVHAQASPPGIPCTALDRAVIANSGQILLNSNTLIDSFQSHLEPYGERMSPTTAISRQQTPSFRILARLPAECPVDRVWPPARRIPTGPAQIK